MNVRRFAVATALTAALAGPSVAAFAQDQIAAQQQITIEVPPTAAPILPNALLAPDARIESLATFPPPTLAELKAKAANEIAKRQVTLSGLAAKLSLVKSDCGQNAAVSQNISATQSGLTTLGATIASDTDLAKAKVDYRSIFGSYRVYALVAPRTHITLNCDNHQTYANNLKASAARLAAAITVAQSKGIDTTVASADLAQATAALDPAVARDVAAVNSVVGLIPDQGDRNLLAANTVALQSAHNQEVAGDSALDGARLLLKAGWESLRGNRSAVAAANRAARDANKAARDAAKAIRDANKAARAAAKANRGVVVVGH